MGYWNAERGGETVSGRVVFDASNPYGLNRAADSVNNPLCGNIALFHRGGPPGVVAPFAMKAHIAGRAGAVAALIIDGPQAPPIRARFGEASLTDEMRIACRSRSCQLPPIPTLLLPHADGQRVLESLCLDPQDGGGSTPGNVYADFIVVQDGFPRPPLWRRLCQECAFVASGVCVLYGVIDCLAVDVGEEFVMAQTAAQARGVPCKCIDVDTDRLCRRVGAALAPTPCNLLRAAAAWLALPRALWCGLFPREGSVDILGCSILHMMSFNCKTWFAMLFAGLCAGSIVGSLLYLFGSGAEAAGEHAGVVPKGSDAAAIQSWIMMAVEMYVFPRLYEAVAVSRDEAMYLGIRACAREHRARRLVVVVGAAHANGILKRATERGLRRGPLPAADCQSATSSASGNP